VTTTSVRSIGTSQLRREDARLLAGAGRYVADVRLPETLYLAVARSEYAHAELGAVDLSMALSAPGVVDAFAASSIGPYN
jgi:carbon-monoxide dehydrogenase large subunit